MTTITFDRRFRGPADSANGGYACGTVASLLSGPAEVTLHAPPPLDTPLELTLDADGRAVLRNGEQEIASASASDEALEIPPPPTFDAAIEATEHYTGSKAHPLPECFVCGPLRETPDGMRVFPGRLEAQGPAIAPWFPDVSLCDDDGLVRPEILWAALDCPGYFGVAETGEAALLGRMTAKIFHRPQAGEACVAMGWSLARDGRKLYAGSAVFDSDGKCCGVSKQVWITPK